MPKLESQAPATWPRNAPPDTPEAEPAGPRPWSREIRADIDRNISVLQRHLRYEMFQRMRPLFRYDRLTEPQWRVLRTLEMFTSLDHSGLCRATGLTKSTVSRIVEALSERGLIELEWPRAVRSKRPAVRRYRVVPTRRARKIFAQARTEAQTRYLDVEAKFGEEDLVELCRLMDRFVVALRGEEFGASDEAHRTHPHRDDRNGRWISNAENARRKELARAFREGI